MYIEQQKPEGIFKRFISWTSFYKNVRFFVFIYFSRELKLMDNLKETYALFFSQNYPYVQYCNFFSATRTNVVVPNKSLAQKI